MEPFKAHRFGIALSWAEWDAIPPVVKDRIRKEGGRILMVRPGVLVQFTN